MQKQTLSLQTLVVFLFLLSELKNRKNFLLRFFKNLHSKKRSDTAILVIRIIWIVLPLSYIPSSNSLSVKNDDAPSASEIFGNPRYHAMSYGGYRESSREIPPTIEEITEDLRIMEAIGVKLLRTYNTSQYPFAERLLAAIQELKEQDPKFEMYVMLGAWIEAHNSWIGGVRQITLEEMLRTILLKLTKQFTWHLTIETLSKQFQLEMKQWCVGQSTTMCTLKQFSNGSDTYKNRKS